MKILLFIVVAICAIHSTTALKCYHCGIEDFSEEVNRGNCTEYDAAPDKEKKTKWTIELPNDKCHCCVIKFADEKNMKDTKFAGCCNPKRALPSEIKCKPKEANGDDGSLEEDACYCNKELCNKNAKTAGACGLCGDKGKAAMLILGWMYAYIMSM